MGVWSDIDNSSSQLGDGLQKLSEGWDRDGVDDGTRALEGDDVPRDVE